MTTINVTTVETSAAAAPQEAAAQEQKLKSALSRVDGLRVVGPTGPGEPGTKSHAAIMGFALEVVTSPHTIAAVGVVLFEWLKHNLGKSVQLVIEGEKIIVESGSHKHVQELVEFLEHKIGSRA